MGLSHICLLLVILLGTSSVQIAVTPPRGLNTWDSFRYWVCEDNVTANVEFMYKNGLVSLGWEYMVIDEGWYRWSNNSDKWFVDGNTVDGYSRYLPTEERFPSSGPGGKLGFKPLCDYEAKFGIKCGVHLISGIPIKAVNLKLPILGTSYTAADIAIPSQLRGEPPFNYGVNMSHPGAQIYYNSLVELLADWGVRFIKFDFSDNADEVKAVALAINTTNLPIVLSVNGAGGSEYGNMWRIGDDVWDVWQDVYEHFGQLPSIVPQARPSHWPDSDMLPIGRIGGLENTSSVYSGPCTILELNCYSSSNPLFRYQECCPRQSRLNPYEIQTLISLWCIVKSPLMYGGYLPLSDNTTVSVISNPEVLDVNSQGTDPRQVRFTEKDQAVWQSSRQNNVYVALFNLKDSSQSLIISFSELRVVGSLCEVRDVWQRKELGKFNGEFRTSNLQPHQCALIYIHDCL